MVLCHHIVCFLKKKKKKKKSYCLEMGRSEVQGPVHKKKERNAGMCEKRGHSINRVFVT
jgi:hypothetical protein